ncbi:hypothetical protein COL26b_014177 [Colletotrichum chrysophilum]|uniref:uncharacterized protein n=1 Tax=Colletotrichum chrysophilum TaxID=1836956 RepID=UPI002300FA08|nr:uncharacterized protein COL26b_014177 [Colletotrichum chrysophilum]KAJ0360104.1 hypothetical protein COL26b_014177 [Colletotrichum chrysophilum]
MSSSTVVTTTSSSSSTSSTVSSFTPTSTSATSSSSSTATSSVTSNQQREYFFHDHFHFVQCFVTGELIILFLNLRNWSVYLIIHCVDNYTNDDTDELSRLHITYIYIFIFSKFFIFHRSLQPLIFLPVHELEHFGIGTSDFASDHQLTHCRSTVSEPRRDPTSLRAKLQPWSRAWAKLFSDHIARRQPESEL